LLVCLLSKTLGKTDLQLEVQNFQKEIDKRTVPFDNITLCAIYVNAFRGIPVIQEQIRTYQDEDGVKVEQNNPEHLLRTLQQYEEKFQAALGKAGNRPSTSAPPAAQPAAQVAKRPASVSGFKQQGSNKKQKMKQGSPFDRLPLSDLQHSPADPRSMRLWIQGSTDPDRKELSKAGKCWLCKQKGHSVTECKQRKDRFTKKELCFYPK
jgi:hypothetical protein